jgi:hypothetical protein
MANDQHTAAPERRGHNERRLVMPALPEIQYENTSYRPGSYGSGKLIRQTEARIGDIRRTAPTKPEAKAAVIEALAAQAEQCYERRYLMGTDPQGEPVVFALHYCDGWGYDIVRGSGRASSCIFDAANVTEALDKMRSHFEQYTNMAPIAA